MRAHSRSAPSPARSGSAADHAIRAANGLVALYLALTLVSAFRWSALHGGILLPVVHLLALGGVLVGASPARWVPRAARDWLPMAVGPFLYVELHWLIAGTGRPHHDATVIGWEHALFGGNPSATWATQAPSRLLSEWLHLSYASYYLLVLFPPVMLYLRGRREDFVRTVLHLTVVYATCFITYLMFPVDGPRYLVGPAGAPDGLVRDFVLRLLEHGSSRGTAFPSSHVAASVVATLCALRTDRRVGVPVALLTVGLTLGTVYGGFHYAVDALAGLVVGLAASVVAERLWAAMRPPGVQSASAA